MTYRIFIFLVTALMWTAGCTKSSSGGSSDGGTDSWITGGDTGTGVDRDTTSQAGEETDPPGDTGTGPDNADTGTGPAGDTGTQTPNDTGTGPAGDTETEADTDTGTEPIVDTSTATLPAGDGGPDDDTGTEPMGDTETQTDTAPGSDTGTAPALDGGVVDSDALDGGPSMDGGEDERDTGEWIDAGICEELGLFIERRPARVMILEDRSLSMDEALPEGSTKWEVAVGAITSLVNDFDAEIEFGLDVFTAADTSDLCTVGTQAVTDVSPANGANIVDILGGIEPGNATPLLLALQNFTDPLYAPTLMDPSGENFLVIVSDGMDTCGADGTFDMDGYDVADDLAAVTAQLLNDYNIRTYVIGFGDGIDPDQLNAIAAAGGTGVDTYYDAANSAELNDVLNEIGETVVVSCAYDIGEYDEEEVNLDQVIVQFDGETIPRDDGCDEGTGWMWTDDTRTGFEFCEGACNTLNNSDIQEVSVSIACEPEDIIVI